MIYEGTIKLEYNGEVIRVNSYHSKDKRNAIIKKWERLYAGKFKNCHLVIVPEIFINNTYAIHNYD